MWVAVAPSRRVNGLTWIMGEGLVCLDVGGGGSFQAGVTNLKVIVM